MTKYYTQEQIDEIGAFMAGKIGENAVELKAFLEQKIAEMEPAENEPSNPDSGGDTPPASGTGGMYLDDGREIKHRLIVAKATAGELIVPHNLNTADILSVEVYCDATDAGYALITNDQGFNGATFLFKLHQGLEAVVINFAESANHVYMNRNFRVFITYLA